MKKEIIIMADRVIANQAIETMQKVFPDAIITNKDPSNLITTNGWGKEDK